MNVQIRPATGRDAAAVARAHVRAWQVAYEGIVSDDYLDSLDVRTYTVAWRKNLTEDFLDNGTPSPTTLVVEADVDGDGPQVVGSKRQLAHAVRAPD